MTRLERAKLAYVRAVSERERIGRKWTIAEARVRKAFDAVQMATLRQRSKR